MHRGWGAFAPQPGMPYRLTKPFSHWLLAPSGLARGVPRVPSQAKARTSARSDDQSLGGMVDCSATGKEHRLRQAGQGSVPQTRTPFTYAVMVWFGVY